jgi:hypothetical protein
LDTGLHHFSSFQSLLDKNIKKFQIVDKNQLLETTEERLTASHQFEESAGKLGKQIGIYFSSTTSVTIFSVDTFGLVFDENSREYTALQTHDYVGRKIFLSLDTILNLHSHMSPFISVPNSEIILFKCK